jgi:hypothetical protein
LEKRKIKRKSFAAREDLLDKMNKVAKENELTLYGFVNEAFDLTLKASELGVNLRTLIDSRELLKIARDKGYTLGLESLWYEMSEIAFNEAKKKSLQIWFNAGVWLAKRYVTDDIEDPIEEFKKDLKEFSWNVPELEINKKNKRISVRVVSPRFSESYTSLFSSLVEGALETFGYEIDNKEIARGIACLEAIKK